MYINGICPSQVEPMDPDIPVIPLGIEATKVPLAIRVKLRQRKEIVMLYPWYVYVWGLETYKQLSVHLFSSFFLLTDHVNSQFP